jgi:hypothetical protein
MVDRLPGLQTRFAIVTSVNFDSGMAQTRWLDDDETGPDIPIPHPFTGRGEGIFIGLRKGTLVALNRASHARYVPVAIIPLRGFYSADLSDIDEVSFDDTMPPVLDYGEIVVKGANDGWLRFAANASIELRNGFEEGLLVGGDDDSAHRCSIARMTPVSYGVSQTGLAACGIVRRDIRPNEESLDAAAYDPMFDLDSEQLLEEVGRDPTQDVTHGTRSQATGGSEVAAAAHRNPPFVERRGILYEFGTEWNVDTRSVEAQRLVDGTLPVRSFSDRRERRSNVMSLSLLCPNELMESVDGTLVDIFGNLLDINRSIILPPKGDGIRFLDSMLENARHTIALHREINTRKGWTYTGAGIPEPSDTPDYSDSSDNARARSRWSVDVDKEGLTKLNIPASSETGNVPCLVRSENSSSVVVDGNGNAEKDGRTETDAKKLFRSDLLAGQQRQDVFLEQFGPGGIKVIPDQQNPLGRDLANRLEGAYTSNVEGGPVLLPGTIQAGTAFHDITRTASKLLEGSMNLVSYEIVDKDAPPVEKDDPAINNQVIQGFQDAPNTPVKRDKAGRPTNYPNAGGRSVCASLDGSLELSIGANTVDRLSWVMDTAGGIVARIGRDRNGRSALIHMDGALGIEVGGFDYVGAFADRRFASRGTSLPRDVQEFRAGKVVLRVRRANPAGTGPDEDPDNLDQTIVIDENGASIQATGQLSLKSTMDMVLQAGSQIVLDAETVVFFKGPQQRMIHRGAVARKVL